MLHLDLDDVQAGMVLGQDVLGAKGQLLLSAGASVSEKQLEILRTHSIRRVVIRPSEPAAPETAVDSTAIDALLDAKFGLCDAQHPLLHELRRLCRKRLSREQGTTE